MTVSHLNPELRNFLLGKVRRGSKREKIELKLMLDDDYFELLLYAEEELIEDYVNGCLSKQELFAFNQHFLITEERLWKIMFFRILRSYCNEIKFIP